MHPLDTKVYLLKRYSPVTAFVPFFSERVMLISCSVIISYINALNAQLIISVLIINVENIFFLLLHHIIIKKKIIIVSMFKLPINIFVYIFQDSLINRKFNEQHLFEI